MISFMVIGAPRSGTAWAANWLTTEKAICWHEPLFTRHLDDLDQEIVGRPLGIADTGIALFPGYLKTHPAKKVILHRNVTEINQSLERMGLAKLDHHWPQCLHDIDGLHVDWHVMFDSPGIIHHYLFGTEPDYRRHSVLRRLNVQADFQKIDPDPKVVRQLLERMHRDER